VLQTLRRSPVVTIDAFATADVMQIPADMPTPERIAADRQELRRLAALIGKLPTRCRDVFTLRKVQGLSQREVAQSLGIAESTVEKHLAKALHLLADAIGRGGKDLDAASSSSEQGLDISEWSPLDDRSRA
jgi:RNA polymerase sigma factor (sigma-70 family)